jgi:hypothetical protein
MATTPDSPTFLHLSEIDLAIKPSAGDRDCLVVTFDLSGVPMRDLQRQLYPRFAALGIQQVLHTGTRATFYGISRDRAADVYAALEDSIAQVNRQRARRWGYALMLERRQRQQLALNRFVGWA